MLKHDNLAMRVDPAWFRQTFLDADAPRSLGKADAVWPWVRGFNEYDGLTMVIAATATHPELFTTFFQPYVCPSSSSIVVGRSEAERGIRDGKKVSGTRRGSTDRACAYRACAYRASTNHASTHHACTRSYPPCLYSLLAGPPHLAWLYLRR